MPSPTPLPPRTPIPRARRLLSALALALLAVQLAWGGAWVAGRSLARIGRAAQHLHETPFEQQSRRLGPPTVDAIEAMRDAIAPGETYLLIDSGDQTGAEDWVRYELAPRRALFLGRLSDLPPGGQLRRAVPRDVRQVVIAGRIPRLLDRYRFLQELAERDR